MFDLNSLNLEVYMNTQSIVCIRIYRQVIYNGWSNDIYVTLDAFDIYRTTTESTTSASYLHLLLSIGRDGQLHTSIYDKRDDFNFQITNFPSLSSNIPSSPGLWLVFISQLIRYARACSSYECFILRVRRLSSKLLKQVYLAERLKSSFRKFFMVETGILFSNMKYPSQEC